MHSKKVKLIFYATLRIPIQSKLSKVLPLKTSKLTKVKLM